MSAPLTIHDLLLELMKTRLEAKLRDEVTDPDTFKLNVIKVGRLQDDPTTRQSNVLLYPGDRDWRDIVDLGGPGMGMDEGPYTVGTRAAFWRRRFTLEMQFYINTTDRDLARKHAMSLKQRIHVALMTIPQAEFPRDAYGEHAYGVQVFDSYLDFGGGSGTFVWRGQMRVEWLTELEPDEDALV